VNGPRPNRGDPDALNRIFAVPFVLTYLAATDGSSEPRQIQVSCRERGGRDGWFDDTYSNDSEPLVPPLFSLCVCTAHDSVRVWTRVSFVHTVCG